MNRYWKISARASLAFLWVFTGLTSLFFQPEFGFDLLERAGITGALAHWFVQGGAVLDIVLGLWVVTPWKRSWCYGLQIATIAAYSLLLTVIAPEFWLHPFGPATKNLPILVLTGLLLVEDRS